MQRLLLFTILLFVLSNLLFAGRYYDAATGRFLQVDPLSEKYPSMSPYNYSMNNPVNFVDPNGKSAISVHYKLTYETLKTYGYSDDVADKMAHMASTYADNPPWALQLFESARSGINMFKRDGVDYSATANAQNDDLGNVVRHAMRSSSDPDSRTALQGMMDGLKFGWDHIFAAGNSEFSSDMNSNFMSNFGVGMHALQDAFAHQGATMKQHLGLSWSSPAMTAYDMLGPTYNAAQLTNTATLVVQILQGNFSNIQPGTTLNLTGMSSAQQQEIIKRLKDQGYTVNEQ